MSCFVECECQQRQEIYAASVWQSESHLFCRQTPAARKAPRHCPTRYCFINAGFDHSVLRLLHMTPAGTRPAAVHCSSPAKIWVGSWLSAATATLPAAFAVAASPIFRTFPVSVTLSVLLSQNAPRTMPKPENRPHGAATTHKNGPPKIHRNSSKIIEFHWMAHQPPH